jgi:transcriptional regulator with XRE-family HTH domain
LKTPTRLKVEIWGRGLTQREVARRARIDEATMSMIANGRLVPTPFQQVKIAEVLDRTVSELFLNDGVGKSSALSNEPIKKSKE